MIASQEVPAGARSGETLVRRGGWSKADIRSVARGDGRAILKDFGDKTWPIRLLGRLQIRREARALDRLRGVPGVPRCYGRVGRFGLLMEGVDGERITRWCRFRAGRTARMFEDLTRLVAEIHARGVAHIDLRKRDNILITADGRPYVIDFNASVCLDGRTRVGRILSRLLRAVDESAVLKWKARLSPDLLTPAECRRHRRMSRLRRLWIFN
ncbi:MAG: lipopolysaccharide kinase InaA family protein [Acidobacteriota bacterium]